jgi:hypothetical protein
MEHQIDAAKFVLVVCTPILRRRFEGKEEPGVGQGANFEGFLATQVLYADGARNEKFVPVLFEPQPANAVPRVLQAFTRYSLGTDYDSLYRHLTGQPAIVAPPLGARKLMPPRAGATTVAPTLPATPVPAAPTIPGADAVLRARDHVHALHELLLLIYDPPELRQFLRFHDQGEKILRSLPARTSASPSSCSRRPTCSTAGASSTPPCSTACRPTGPATPGSSPACAPAGRPAEVAPPRENYLYRGSQVPPYPGNHPPWPGPRSAARTPATDTITTHAP